MIIITEYQFEIYCPICEIGYRTQKLKLPFKMNDLFYSIYPHKCINHTAVLQIKKIKEIHLCNCEKCTGLSSIESYYKDDEDV